MKSLRDHYSGEGNTSRRITVAERLRDKLHYKNERLFQFSSFLDKIQKMFNIFEKENEPISDQAKDGMLSKKIEHPQLQDTIGALKVRSNMDGVTFTKCATHIAAQAQEGFCIKERKGQHPDKESRIRQRRRRHQAQGHHDARWHRLNWLLWQMESAFC